LNEIDLAVFYYLGKSFSMLGDEESALACFHVVWSQQCFAKKMLSGFAEYCAMAAQELSDIAAERGEEYVNGFDVKPFFASQLGKKSGMCFIATACYGSPFAPEVLFLQQLRDRYLRKTSIGRAAIQFYELTSPPIARCLSRSPFWRRTVRRLVVRPLLGVARRISS